MTLFYLSLPDVTFKSNQDKFDFRHEQVLSIV